MKNLIFTLFLILFSFSMKSQNGIFKPSHLNNEVDKEVTELVFNSLDSLYTSMLKKKIDNQYIKGPKAGLTLSTLKIFQEYEVRKDTTRAKFQDKQITNFYQVSKNEFLLTIAYINISDISPPIFLYQLNLLAKKNGSKITFSIPIDYLTRYWNSTKVGNIVYFHRDSLNLNRARLFNDKNNMIASNLGLSPEKFDFYICDNQQEVFTLLGLEYSIYENGKTRAGYGVDSGAIFSIMKNEDFSHDVFHFYSSKINKRQNRNWIAEEGVAYLWGNAYYTDKKGEMVTLKRLVDSLKIYISKNPEVSLMKLFTEDPKIFKSIAPEISIRSTISGLLAHEVENKMGIEGVNKLLNCGSSDRMENYLRIIDELIDISKKNFQLEVANLIDSY